MPAEFIIDVRQCLVFSKGWGVLQPQDLWSHQERLAAHADFRPHFNQLVDMREVSKVEVTAEQFAQIAALALFDRAAHRAILVTSDLQFGLSRMYETFSEMNGDTGVQVFRNAQEAFAFLGIDGAPPAEAFTRPEP